MLILTCISTYDIVGGKSLSRRSSTSSQNGQEDDNSQDSVDFRRDMRRRRKRRGFGWAQKTKSGYSKTIKRVQSDDGFVYEYYIESEIPVIAFDIGDTFILDSDKSESAVAVDKPKAKMESPPFIHSSSYHHADDGAKAEDLSTNKNTQESEVKTPKKQKQTVENAVDLRVSKETPKKCENGSKILIGKTTIAEKRKKTIGKVKKSVKNLLNSVNQKVGNKSKVGKCKKKGQSKAVPHEDGLDEVKSHIKESVKKKKKILKKKLDLVMEGKTSTGKKVKKIESNVVVNSEVSSITKEVVQIKKPGRKPSPLKIASNKLQSTEEKIKLLNKITKKGLQKKILEKNSKPGKLFSKWMGDKVALKKAKGDGGKKRKTRVIKSVKAAMLMEEPEDDIVKQSDDADIAESNTINMPVKRKLQSLPSMPLKKFKTSNTSIKSDEKKKKLLTNGAVHVGVMNNGTDVVDKKKVKSTVTTMVVKQSVPTVAKSKKLRQKLNAAIQNQGDAKDSTKHADEESSAVKLNATPCKLYKPKGSKSSMKSSEIRIGETTPKCKKTDSGCSSAPGNLGGGRRGVRYIDEDLENLDHTDLLSEETNVKRQLFI
jgi:hypothetical protein